MTSLDGRTVERVARLVVDLDGPTERHGYELERLLRDAGWSDPPEYDGSPRVQWLVDAIGERVSDRSEMDRLLRRLCDPLEYDAGRPAAEAVQRELNRILESERLAVTYVAGRPVVGDVSDGTSHVDARLSVPIDIEKRLHALIADGSVVDVLLSRISQSRAAEEAGAYLLAVFGIGSFVEGLLFSVLTERHPELSEKGFLKRNGRYVPAERVGMYDLIDIAHREGLIELDAKDFMNPVREFRNFIHPRRQLELGFDPDRDTVALSWGPVHAILNDLEESAEAAGPPFPD